MLRARVGWLLGLAMLGIVLAVSATPAHALDDSPGSSFSSTPNAAGFGVIFGGGSGELNADVRKAGFTSRRIEDGDRSGALTLMGETYNNGIPFDLLDKSLSKKDVHLEYDALYVELKRYFPVYGPLHTFWGLRGGATRITGTIQRPGQKNESFQDNQVAPLWFLAVPLALENPGFLLLGMVEGGAVGLSWDIIPRHLWLEGEVTAAIIPHYRNDSIAIDNPFVLTRTITLSAAF